MLALVTVWRRAGSGVAWTAGGELEDGIRGGEEGGFVSLWNDECSRHVGMSGVVASGFPRKSERWCT